MLAYIGPGAGIALGPAMLLLLVAAALALVIWLAFRRR